MAPAPAHKPRAPSVRHGRGRTRRPRRGTPLPTGQAGGVVARAAPPDERAGPRGAFDEGWEARAAARRRIFDGIADDYDALNDLLSLGLHRAWKRAAVAWTRADRGQACLDVCTGTGDIAQLLASAAGPTGRVVGLDFAPDILAVAKRRPQRSGSAARVEWIEGDAMNLPFGNATFDAATCGYGLRNVADRPRAIAELARVLRPGARLAVLDFNNAADKSAANAAQTWTLANVVVPVARARGFEEEYAYLQPSIKSYPTGRELENMARNAGFADAKYYELYYGLMGCLVATR